MKIGYIGLGKMGLNMVTRLKRKKHAVVAFDSSVAARAKARRVGASSVESLVELVVALERPRVIWIMVPHQAVKGVIKQIAPHLSRGDTLIDGGNSPYEQSVAAGRLLAQRGIKFIDVGVSGGPGGARDGACLMVGATAADFKRCEPLFRDLSVRGGYAHVGKIGAGHFVKMVHNGIEYGMMQAIAEGFAVMKKSPLRLDVVAIANLFNHGSVIESRLIEWLGVGLKRFGSRLGGISGRVAHSGEGEWTVKAARKLSVPAPVIEAAFQFRVASWKNPSYTGRLLTTLRNQFGGHALGVKRGGTKKNRKNTKKKKKQRF